MRARSRYTLWTAWSALALLLIARAASHLDYGTGYSRRVFEVASSSMEGRLVIEELAPREQLSKRPAVVLVHGYLANPAMLDRLYAEELVRRGILVFIPRGFMDAGVACSGDCQTLQARTAPILAVLDALRGDPRVDRDRIGLFGHSFGSSLAMETACADWSIRATVAMAGSLQSLAYVNHACPRNLLLLHGDADRFTSDRHQHFVLAKATRGILRAENVRWGSIARGDARLLKIISGAGHVTILGTSEARQLTVDWLEEGLGGAPQPTPVRPLPLGWLVIGLFATIVLVESAAAQTIGAESPRHERVPAARLVLAGVGLLLIGRTADAAAPYVYSRLQPHLALTQLGGQVLVATLVVGALSVLHLSLAGVWWSRRARVTSGNWWRPALGVMARTIVLYCCLQLLLQGYFETGPTAVRVLATIAWAPVLFASLLLVSAAAAWFDACFAGLPAIRRLRLPRVLLAIVLVAAFGPMADRYNDVVAPAIHLVPFRLAVAVVVIGILGGSTDESAAARAGFATVFALWLLALVFPLSSAAK